MALRQDTRSGREVERRGKLMIFGRPTLLWENAPTPEEYYASTGFEEVHTMDVSDYEGATFIHDLNLPEVPAHLKGQYRSVTFGGTAEHVYNIGNVLKAAADLLEVGGTVTCSGPANNWLDHGFYQICPTLKFDFFETNGFECLTSKACLHMPGEHSLRRWIPVYPGEASGLNFISARVSHTLIAKKLAGSTSDRIPLQSIYRLAHAGEVLPWRFKATVPYDTDNARRIETPMRRFAIDKATIEPRDGGWAAPFPMTDHPEYRASTPERPFLSRALVYENESLLPWIVSQPGMVAQRPGSFCHHGEHVHFTARRGEDPRTNDKRYVVAFPQPYDGLAPYRPDKRFTRLADGVIEPAAAILAPPPKPRFGQPGRWLRSASRRAASVLAKAGGES